MEVKEIWKIARDHCCDNCNSARGCTAPCQLLRNYVSKTSYSNVSVKVTKDVLD